MSSDFQNYQWKVLTPSHICFANVLSKQCGFVLTRAWFVYCLFQMLFIQIIPMWHHKTCTYNTCSWTCVFFKQQHILISWLQKHPQIKNINSLEHWNTEWIAWITLKHCIQAKSFHLDQTFSLTPPWRTASWRRRPATPNWHVTFPTILSRPFRKVSSSRTFQRPLQNIYIYNWLYIIYIYMYEMRGTI